MAAQRVAHCCSCCLLPNTSCSNRHDTSSCCRLNSCNNCFPPPEARTAVEKEEECRFSSLSLLRTFLQRLPTAVAYPCAFSQSVFTPGLSSSHQISQFWSSLGHHGHCCVFGVVFGLFGTQRVSRLPFSALPSLVAECLTCSRSGGRTATAACHVL